MKNKAIHLRLGFALNGILFALKSEASFRTQLLAAMAIAIVLIVTRPSPVWWGIIILTTGAVLAAELFNTALEKTLDHLHPAQHPQIKLAKDAAAGAVLVLGLTAILVFISFLASVFPG
ncbi:diacylglycerol kinase (ATP) [Thiogranum longum]|uniref:Diacylglycerol kinase (ATP) n=2 Tax=Thiogranum longum TaxID=1537524 RepID=A0A4R1HN00_9GAMM|nr:diacylglycerol kinase (ATP) [Thiogranum longum]